MELVDRDLPLRELDAADDGTTCLSPFPSDSGLSMGALMQEDDVAISCL
jgi:hypothetical protein